MTPSESPFLVGIDLGTTNSAVAFVDTRRGSRVQVFRVPQLTQPGLVEPYPVLPSFLYFPEAHEIDSAALSTSWAPRPDAIVGVLARERGALAPARLVASAKSWLAHPAVDRRAAILPWGEAAGPRISPVDASARYLAHIRDSWNATLASTDPTLRLERQAVVLTVPASFDEEARELTVQAARDAEFANLTLIEEPIAAFYAWMAGRQRASRRGERFDEGQVALVCDVGGGTSDFSLIRVSAAGSHPGRGVSFERIAIGDHLLLGGDNVDLALASVAEQRLTASRPDLKLAITQRSALRRLCSAAKERLLGDEPPDEVTVTLLGAGHRVIGEAMTTTISRADAERTIDQFLPISADGEIAAPRDRRAGLRELGLPFESDPAITRHLAGFLARSARAAPGSVATVGGRDLVRPDVVLFNGGFFRPTVARERVVQALGVWFGAPPRVLTSGSLDAAVALGAAVYGRLRAHIGPSLSFVKAGSGYAYYIGLRGPDAAHSTPAVCVLARGTEEGTETRIDHPFTVMTNRPVSFALYSSTIRTDRTGDVVALTPEDHIREHAPIVTVLRYGKKSRQVELPVTLSAAFTEVGTLELWCESQASEHRWRLQFQLRGADTTEEDEGEDADATASTPAAADAVLSEEAVAEGERAIRAVFDTTSPDVTAETLVAHLEQLLGFGKTAWPLPVIRRFADVLLEVAPERRRSAALEARWLNLFGFCLRPGFGAAKDPWRISGARTVYAAGLAFSGAVQNRAEWLVLWERVAGGFSAGQQRELAQRVMGDLGLGGKKAPRLSPQEERESWRLGASLERLDIAMRTRIGDELVRRIRRASTDASLLWAIGRVGARSPFYGPLSSVVPPQDAARWLDALLSVKITSAELIAAIVQVAGLTGDSLRDLDERERQRAGARLRDTGAGDEVLRALEQPLARSAVDASRVFGEPLPSGLRLAVE